MFDKLIYKGDLQHVIDMPRDRGLHVVIDRDTRFRYQLQLYSKTLLTNHHFEQLRHMSQLAFHVSIQE